MGEVRFVIIVVMNSICEKRYRWQAICLEDAISKINKSRKD